MSTCEPCVCTMAKLTRGPWCLIIIINFHSNKLKLWNNSVHFIEILSVWNRCFEYNWFETFFWYNSLTLSQNSFVVLHLTTFTIISSNRHIWLVTLSYGSSYFSSDITSLMDLSHRVGLSFNNLCNRHWIITSLACTSYNSKLISNDKFSTSFTYLSNIFIADEQYHYNEYRNFINKQHTKFVNTVSHTYNIQENYMICNYTLNNNESFAYKVIEYEPYFHSISTVAPPYL